MKKILCVVLALSLVMTSFGVMAKDKASEASQRLKSLNLMEERDFDETVNRADVVSVIVKLVTSNAVLPVSNTVFLDVPSDHKSAGEIYYAYQMGWISGVDENHFNPDSPATLQQFLKVATSALGYRTVAENAGGYVGGYYQTAIKIGLLKNLNLEETSALTVSDVLSLLNNMLDAKTLEPKIGTDEFLVSEDTLIEQLMERADLKEIEGTVQSVGKQYISGGRELTDGKIMIEGKTFLCDLDFAYDMLGKKVTAYYKEDVLDAIATIVTVFADEKNSELKVMASAITALNEDEIEILDENDEEEKINIASNADFVYNGSVIPKNTVEKPVTGTVTLLDRDGDEDYDVLFIEEYESFLVDRISETNHTIYFKNEASYRGKTGFWFDFDDRDKVYVIKNADGEEIEFSNIEVGMVISIAADLTENLVTVTVSDKTVEGTIERIASSDNEIVIADKTYLLYAGDAEALLAEYKVGQKAVFALNHSDEIVGTKGDIFSDGKYGYVIGFSSAKGFSNPQIRVVMSGTSKKTVTKSGDDEVIKYTYTNGNMEDYTFADNVMISFEGGRGSKVKATNIKSSIFARGVIYFKLNSNGEINSADIYTVPEYTTAQAASSYAYKFNGKLNSFGGYPAKDAFFVSEATQVICVPKASYPDNDDYTVDVTIKDEEGCVIMPVRISETTQLAESAVILSPMDANTPKPLSDDDKISIVGNVKMAIDEKGEDYYKLEVLTEGKLYEPYIYASSQMSSVVSDLVCGDLIRYNTKASGEIANIEFLQSLAGLGDQYFINRENTSEESCYARVESITLNRLDNLRNEMVDAMTVDNGIRVKPYTLLREEGPAIYSYNRRTGEIKIGVTDEIAPADRVGDGASDVFMLVNQNEPTVLVILVD